MTPPRPAAVALLLCALAGPVAAQTLRGSGEFQISSQTSGNQRSPRVTASAAGGFAVVWFGYSLDGAGSGVAGRSFERSGLPAAGDFQVNGYTTGYQGSPSIAAVSDDGFVVAWDIAGEEDDYGVFARGFDASGPVSGGDALVNAYTTGLQIFPVIAGAPGREAIIVWTSLGQDGAAGGIYGRRADASGLPLGNEFRVNIVTAGAQWQPEVAMDASGNFVVVWESFPQDTYGGLGVYGRIFDSNGAPRGAEIIVNSFALSSRFQPDVAMNRDGEFVVAWQLDEPGGPGSDIFARRYDSTGAPVGAEMPVNSWTTGFQESPTVALDTFGNFMVVWESYDQDGDLWGLFGRIFDAGDQPVGAEIQVNTWTTGLQAEPDVAAVGTGDFVGAWHSDLQDQDGYGSFGQRFLIAGFCSQGDADADGVCDDFDNCPALDNPSQSDDNFNGVGNACDLEILSPTDGSTVDCSNPALSRPSFTWTAAAYDRFRVLLSPDPSFPDGQRLSSGDSLLTSPSWTPSKGKWSKACRQAGAVNSSDPRLYVMVQGRDRDLSKHDPRRKSDSPSIVVKLQS